MTALKIVNRIELWPIDRLIPYTRNACTHSDLQIAQIAASMQAFGVVNAILVDKHGTVIAGHGRILAALRLGLTNLPVIVLDHLTEVGARELRIADNKIAQNAGCNHENLTYELAALLEEKVDLAVLGFSELELKRVLAELEIQTGRTDEDAVPESPQQPTTEIGEMWRLGDHRILCADSTSLQCVQQCLEGRGANLIFADAPYNVNFAGSPRPSAAGTSHRPILNDNLGNRFANFLKASCAVMLTVSAGAIYICMSSSELHTLYQTFTEAGGHWSTFVIWAKNTFTLGRSDFQRMYEPILYGWREGGTHFWSGARDQADVWFIDKPRVNDLHPTMKPVELIEQAILHSSQRGDMVLDPFGGAGSTMIACHKTGRRARLLELDARYVDVTIARWQLYTGEKAVLASDGRSFDEVSQERQAVNGEDRRS